MSTLKKFPLAHIILLLITILCIGNTARWWDELTWINKTIIASTLVFFLSLYGPIITLYHKNSKYNKMFSYTLWLQILTIIIWIGYFLILPESKLYKLVYTEWLFYYWIFPLTILWIFLLIARFSRKDEDWVWLAWDIIIKAIIFWGLAWWIVYWGLSWALASIEALFDVDLSWHRYSYFWYVSMILLAGSFMLNYYLTETENTPLIPKSRMRKVFWCYIILPLAMIYLLIFLAYWIKILITWIWPKGIIVWLGTWYFTLWMISYFLTYPEKTKIYDIIHKILFWSFLFVATMMVCAIIKRVNQYGITINRYFVCMLIWGIIIFSILALSMKRRIWFSFITITFVLLLVSFYGPLNAGNVSLGLQYKRLSKLLSTENINLPLGNNSLANLTWDNARIIVSLIDEIVENNDISERWDKIITVNDLEDIEDLWRWGLRNRIHWILSLEDYYSLNESEYFNFWGSTNNIWYDIAWYSKMYSISLYKDSNYELPKEVGWNFEVSNYVDALYIKTKEESWKDSDKIQPYIIDEGDKRYIITSAHWEKKSDNSLQINGIQWYILLK